MDNFQKEATPLIEFADELRLETSAALDAQRRSKLGQFMTPGRTASFMASMFGEMPNEVRLLEAGAGVGSLVAAFVNEACSRDLRPSTISVTAFEIDPSMLAGLRRTLEACSHLCASLGVAFSAEVVEDDFILASAEPLLGRPRTYNCAILNPPYAKINAKSKWRTALRNQGIETVNLYTAFVGLAVQQLETDGELVAITPRSFCNGPYYKPFRRLVLNETSVLRLHVFKSRKSTFKDDDVLQENMIFHLKKGAPQKIVELSTDDALARSIPFEEIVRPSDEHAFIRLPVDDADSDLATRVQALPCTLSDLGVKVSTGRVVDFRAKEHLRKMPSERTVPLLYPSHFRSGVVDWPLPNFKKFNALADNEDTAALQVPAGTYVLTKRFSAKEERRRVVATVYEGEGPAGFENHLNYFHQDGRGLSPMLARGLANFLNSTAVDQYFRQFSGHTQVNATDLRNLHYPSRGQLEELGAEVNGGNPNDAVARLL